jgi:hypothetical protein
MKKIRLLIGLKMRTPPKPVLVSPEDIKRRQEQIKPQNKFVNLPDDKIGQTYWVFENPYQVYVVDNAEDFKWVKEHQFGSLWDSWLTVVADSPEKAKQIFFEAQAQYQSYKQGTNWVSDLKGG